MKGSRRTPDFRVVDRGTRGVTKYISPETGGETGGKGLGPEWVGRDRYTFVDGEEVIARESGLSVE